MRREEVEMRLDWLSHVPSMAAPLEHGAVLLRAGLSRMRD